jgi:K+-transporting ATPase ATPase A chain
MTANGWAQIVVFLGAVLLVTKPLGLYLARVFDRRRTFLDPVARPVERLLYRLTRVDEAHEMAWTEYGAAMLLFSLVSLIVLYGILRLQAWQPWGNPQALSAVPPYLAFNTAVSFTTNTNWQAYGGESTVSYLTQMAGLAYHNFLSAAVGIALAVAFVRGIARRESASLGNFWVDLTRAWLWVLLPLCLAGALVLVSQGVVQNFRPYDRARLVDPQPATAPNRAGAAKTAIVVEQLIAQGPVASQ